MALKAVRYNRQVDSWASDAISYLHVKSDYYSGSFENLTAPSSPNYPDTLSGSPVRYFMDTPWIINVDDLASTRPCALYDVTNGLLLTRVTGAPSANEYRLPPDTSIARHRIELGSNLAGVTIGYDFYADGSALAGVDWNTPIFTDSVIYRNTVGTETTTGFRTKMIEIGDWDMNFSTAGTQDFNVNHGLSDYTKVRSINVIIRIDDDSVYYNFLAGHDNTPPPRVSQDVPVITVQSTQVNLKQGDVSLFDTVSFDDFGGVAGNRGFIYIDYEV